jgi:hypothetical protein
LLQLKKKRNNKPTIPCTKGKKIVPIKAERLHNTKKKKKEKKKLKWRFLSFFKSIF